MSEVVGEVGGFERGKEREGPLGELEVAISLVSWNRSLLNATQVPGSDYAAEEMIWRSEHEGNSEAVL